MSATEREAARSGSVPSSPVFFRLIRRSMGLFVAAACALAAIFPAPLQEPADFGKVPNPAKSAWFLLWLQELVSYGTRLIYAVVLLALFVFLLPYTRWGARDLGPGTTRRPVAVFAVAVFVSIIVLTVVAFFFRGRDWALSVHP
ncbi:MAG: cytochrome B6 [Gemmatimonadota bacterium]